MSFCISMQCCNPFYNNRPHCFFDGTLVIVIGVRNCVAVRTAIILAVGASCASVSFRTLHRDPVLRLRRAAYLRGRTTAIFPPCRFAADACRGFVPASWDWQVSFLFPYSGFHPRPARTASRSCSPRTLCRAASRLRPADCRDR